MPSQELSVATPPTPKDSFHTLVSSLSRLLGPSSGLDSADVNVEELRELMEGYVSREEDWQKYEFADHSVGYTRNLVDEGNGKSNLLLLIWSPGKGSHIHDHANAHCLMRILKGSLLETRYATPTEDVVKPLEKIGERLYREGEVAYMADELGVHRISDPDEREVAVSLHLYTPPNAAKFGCNVFDEQTGEGLNVSQDNFYSRFGRRITSNSRL